jgi:hypothetical protein
MKLFELVTYFRKGGSFEFFCKNQNLDCESEVIEIFMCKPLLLDSDLVFVEIEKTRGANEYKLGDNICQNLFDFYYFIDAIAESNSESNIGLSDEAITKKLYSYAINDA